MKKARVAALAIALLTAFSLCACEEQVTPETTQTYVITENILPETKAINITKKAESTSFELPKTITTTKKSQKRQFNQKHQNKLRQRQFR